MSTIASVLAPLDQVTLIRDLSPANPPPLAQETYLMFASMLNRCSAGAL